MPPSASPSFRSVFAALTSPNPYLHIPAFLTLPWGVLPLSQTNIAKAELLLFPKLPHLDKQHYNVTSCSSKISRLSFIPLSVPQAPSALVYFPPKYTEPLFYSRLAISTSLRSEPLFFSSVAGTRGRHAPHSPPCSSSGFWTKPTSFSAVLNEPKTRDTDIILCLKLSNGVLLALRLIFNLIESFSVVQHLQAPLI